MPADLSSTNSPVDTVDVLLTHSYHLASDAKQWRKMQPYPPLGTLYAATTLQASGLAVAVFDPMLTDPITGFVEALRQHRPQVVVLYEDDFNFVTKMCLTHMRELAFSLARLAQAHGATVIAHGSDATDHPAVYLDQGIAYILNGEAEHNLAQLCAAILNHTSPLALPGLVCYTGNTLHTSRPALKNSLWATLPPVDRSLIDLAPYRAAWVERHGFFSTNVVASRGCPYQCNWCAKPISGDRFHLRSPQAVADELHDLKTVHGVDHIWFGDDVFALDRRWLQTFADAVTAHGTPLPFKVQSRADLMSEANVAALRRAGCVEVWLGAESGSQTILNAMNKGITLADIRHARTRLATAGIRACFFLQFGYPGEGWAEIAETIQLVRETRPDDIGVSVSYPLPGTVFYERVQQHLGAKRNWADSDDLCTIHTAAYQDTFYQALRNALHAEVSLLHAEASALNAANVAALWHRVHALEPVSRNTNVLQLSGRPDTFVPLVSLAAAPGRA